MRPDGAVVKFRRAFPIVCGFGSWNALIAGCSPHEGQRTPNDRRATRLERPFIGFSVIQFFEKRDFHIGSNLPGLDVGIGIILSAGNGGRQGCDDDSQSQ